ncbi:unnamed protein product [Mycena citricolor]|uniref:Peptide hydrolase n=1 Tax=Mycena citricolor TaxID=2018698 RepID=A0AAD2H376_9AGAR|nr:unnamed protein product [Mycena citricolor]
MSLLSPKWGLGRSLLALAPVLLLGSIVALRHHYILVKPNILLTDPLTHLPQISESRILDVARHLSEGIGYRTVGTTEHAEGDAWMIAQAQALKTHCDAVVRAEPGRRLECEVWHQRGSGTHRFDMMGKRLYKTYQNLTNIIVRLSDGTDAGKEHALLVNSHVDSTLPSPGAADDALAVGAMLDCIRVLLDTPGWSPAHAAIFLFNNAEESLQDGSHLYSTQHPTAATVRAVINLEAAGTTGRELLFQATSEEMVEAYSRIPHRFGTIFANEVFNSDSTDFRQFEEYLTVPGLDMAVVGNSYLYHMRKDLVENIQVGNMGENTLALVKYITAAGSSLPTVQKKGQLQLVFFSFLDYFVMYSFSAAKVLYGLGLVAVLAATRSVWRGQRTGILAASAGLLGSLFGVNLLAVMMKVVLGKGMSWFAGGHFAVLALYGPAALLGAFASQLAVPTTNEKAAFASILLLQSAAAFVLQLINVGTGLLFFLPTFPSLVSLLLNDHILTKTKSELSLWTYVLAQAVPISLGAQLIIVTLEVFVPLTGRMGTVPADHIVGTLVAVLGSQALPLLVPFAHRFGKPAVRRIVSILGLVVVINMAVFAARNPFDEMHQKRLFVIHAENVTTNEHHLHLATSDGAPGFPNLVQDISAAFGSNGQEATAVVMNDHNTDWDPLYPFSAFLYPYKIQLPVDPEYVSPWTKPETAFSLTAVDDKLDSAAGTRSFTLRVHHPGLIWTVIAFDAHVLEWTLDRNPPAEYARHHVKEASFVGTDTYTIDLVVNSTAPIAFHFIGIQETAMWPAKQAVPERGPAMQLFARLDAWLDETTGGTVDALLMGCVAGSVVV